MVYFIFPLGGARGGGCEAVGGVGGVLGIGGRYGKVIQEYEKNSNHATNFEPYGSRFVRALRSEQGEATPQIQKRRKQKNEPPNGDSLFCWLPPTCLHVFGPRTMRQTSSLTALVGRISREILPPVRAFGAQGGAFGYRRGSQREKHADWRAFRWLPLLDSNQRHPD